MSNPGGEWGRLIFNWLCQEFCTVSDNVNALIYLNVDDKNNSTFMPEMYISFQINTLILKLI